MCNVLLPAIFLDQSVPMSGIPGPEKRAERGMLQYMYIIFQFY
jgi:hypothetical protein